MREGVARRRWWIAACVALLGRFIVTGVLLLVLLVIGRSATEIVLLVGLLALGIVPLLACIAFSGLAYCGRGVTRVASILAALGGLGLALVHLVPFVAGDIQRPVLVVLSNVASMSEPVHFFAGAVALAADLIARRRAAEPATTGAR